MALLVQNFWENNFCQNPFSVYLKKKNKKVPMTTQLEGGEVKALVAGQLNNNFLRLP